MCQGDVFGAIGHNVKAPALLESKAKRIIAAWLRVPV